MEAKKGSLIVVGGGINIGPQTTLSAKAHIEHADIVLTAVTGKIAAKWIDDLNDNVFSLSQFYAQGKSRLKTYHQMIDTICDKVREGLRVCVVLYGHPGVFAMPAHKAIEKLRAEGYKASMDPGVSAEDCLVADLGIDPGATGCQAFETT